MRVVQVIGRIAERFGGPQRSVRQLTSLLAAAGHAVTVVGTDAGERGLSIAEAEAQHGRYRVCRGVGSYAFSPRVPQTLAVAMQEADIVHVHGMYTFPAAVAAYLAERKGLPYVVHVHGAADAFHHSKRRWKKIPYERLIQRPQLERAAYALTLSEGEKREVEQAFRLGNVRVIEPAIPIWPPPEDPLASGLFDRVPRLRNRRLVTFMARLSAQKGALIMLEAFGRVAGEFPDAELVFAGSPDRSSFLRELNAGIRKAGLGNRVSLVGVVGGVEKAALLCSSTVVALPSQYESFGLTIAEGMAAGVPVLATRGVGIAAAVEGAGAGVVVEPTAASVAEGLRIVLSEARSEEFGRRGRALVAERFSPERVSARLVAVYRRAIATAEA